MKKKILLVEDDEINRKLFVSILSLNEKGYEILEAADGEEAIKKISEESPSLILLDMIIPKINGIEVFRICKERGLLKDKKVYALTAAVMPETLEEGFDGVITKPIRVMDFIETVNKALE